MRLVLAASIALLPLAACGNGADDGGIAGSGSGGSRSYPVEGFTTVALDGPDDASVSVGTGFSLRAEGDPSVLDKLRITRDGETLRIGRRSGGLFGVSRGSAKVYVTMPAIQAAKLAGSGDMSVDRASGETMALSLVGSGNLSVAALEVARAQLSIAGSGNLRAAGNADALAVKITGAGDVDAGGLKADGAEVSIAGSGSVKAAVTGRATVKITGSGDVDLGPAARCETQMMGSGTVRCGN